MGGFSAPRLYKLPLNGPAFAPELDKLPPIYDTPLHTIDGLSALLQFTW